MILISENTFEFRRLLSRPNSMVNVYRMAVPTPFYDEHEFCLYRSDLIYLGMMTIRELTDKFYHISFPNCFIHDSTYFHYIYYVEVYDDNTKE